MFPRPSYLPRLSRRDWLRLTTAGVVGYSLSGWLERLAAETALHPERRRACILLWMNGGPSQFETFDVKPGHANGGPTKEIATSVPGIKISEHLPKVATHAHELAIVRSMSTKEGDHDRAAYYLRTGYRPGGPIQYPAFGALVGKELGDEQAELPGFVSIAPYRFTNPAAYGSGFLGPRYAPLVVGDNNVQFNPQANYDQALKVQDLLPPKELEKAEVDSRIDLVSFLETDFVSRHGGIPGHSHQAAYERAVRLMRGSAAKAFSLDEEDPRLRDSYGRNLFGQGCLLARRLVEQGVPFIEVTLGSVPGVPEGWDTHQNNFDQVPKLCKVLDTAWAALLDDLRQRGLLETTVVVWMGEFGRTPRINPQKGRDHFPNAWSTALAGGGIKGGQVVGKTSPDGMAVAEQTVQVPDLLATVCKALGVDPRKQNPSNVGRPIRIADPSAKPLTEVLA
jgi:hypothetical protein